MRRFTNNFGGRTALALFVAAGGLSGVALAQPSLAVLNAGPSSATVPTANNNAVLTVRYPREVVDTAITDINPNAGGAQVILPTNLANNALAVQQQGSTTTGIRLRSRAVLGTGTVAGNAEIAFAGQLGFDADASESYIAFLPLSTAQTIDTLAELEAVVGAGSANGPSPGTAYVKYLLSNSGLNGGAGFADGDVEDAAFNTGNGVEVLVADLNAATPNGGGAVGAWRNFEVAILVVEDVAGGNQTTDVVTEYIFVRNPAAQLEPTAASSATNGSGQITQLTIATNLQLTDDDGANPADSDPIAIADFRVRPNNTGPTVSLTDYLASLTGPPVAGAITITGSTDGDYERVITIPFTTPIASADAANVRASSVGFASAAPNARGVSGETSNGNVNTYQLMGEAAALTVNTAALLQGSGGTGGDARAIWMAVTASGGITSTGDNNQFILVNEDGQTVATSNLVTLTRPATGDVPGINDTNLDGTTTDPVVDESANRVFVRFVRSDSDDTINSDGTWSNDALEFGSEGRVDREPVRLRDNPAATNFIQNILGGDLSEDTDSAVTSNLARPLIVARETRSTGSNDPLGRREVADGIAVVFDKSVSNVTTNRFGVTYNTDIDISDLTAGLGSGLALRTAEVLDDADFADRVLSTGTVSLTQTFVSSDTALFVSPTIPLDGTAADGTSTSIRPGTGFINQDAPYAVGVNANAVTAGTLGNTASGTFSMANVLTGDAVNVTDGAEPTLVAVNGFDTNSDGGLNRILFGMSEDVYNDNGLGGAQTSEAESYVFFMTNETNGRRIAIPNATIHDLFSVDGSDPENVFRVELMSGEQLNDEAQPGDGFVAAIFNPGFPIWDLFAENRVDENFAKTNMVEITPPAAGFKDEGVATVDPVTDKVTSVMIKTTSEVELNSGGTLAALADRFFARGDDFGDDEGRGLELGDLIQSITIGTTPDEDGCYTITLTFMSGMPFTQEDFFIEYADTDSLEDPSGTFLVDADTGAEIDGESIYVTVLRAPVNEGDPTSPDGNPLTMTIAGTLDLGGGQNALGSEVDAYVWLPTNECGTLEFTYKGVRYVGTVDSINDDGNDTISDGTVLYFHPQLMASQAVLDSDCSDGAMEPMGVVNRKPDFDITATIGLANRDDEGDINFINDGLIYQNLATQFAIAPIQLTVRRPTTGGSVGVFTVQGTGISNGTLTFSGGRFEHIGETVVTAPVTGTGSTARPFILHTRGNKAYNGRPVVVTVTPEDFFAPNADGFLANNLLVNALRFQSDIDRSRTGTGNPLFTNADPVNFNINRMMISEFDLSGLRQDGWAILGADRNNNGNDFGVAGQTGNRVTAGSNPVNTLVGIPSDVGAQGYFVVLNSSNNPELLEISTLLAIDSRGVFCGSVNGLTRIQAGHGFAVEATNLSGRRWFTFGQAISDINGAFLNVDSNTANGGWLLLTNATGGALTNLGAVASGNQIFITMNNANGVRIFVEGQPSATDLTTVPVNAGFLHFTDTDFNLNF